ncbi:MAG TPA: MnhB domain-containing protein [Acidobacteriaceae bacterium]|nr:MnhB domain-containing protein [Acidobacteriaceae bacterium]
MTRKWRLGIFYFSAAFFLAFYMAAARNLPPWGQYRGPYGDVISSLAVYERHATDVVNAIDYDYRGFDTLGEEFILFTSVLGVMLLLRNPEPKPGTAESDPGLSKTVKVTAATSFGITFIFGLYMCTHGQLTPGGGFQGGVIVATAFMLVYIAENMKCFKDITSHPLMEVLEALGAGLYALTGVSALAIGVPFLTNWIPLGTTGDVFSSGTIAVISASVGGEVAAGFILLSYTYLQDIISSGGSR